MSKRQIRKAFEVRLSTWAAARDTPLRIAWENAPFTPTVGETFLRAFIVPAETDSQDLAGAHRVYTGLFQVSIIGEAGKGAKAVEEIAQELESLFPLNLRIPVTGGNVLVYTPISEGPAMPDGGTYTLPVWCRYRMDTI